MKKFKFLFVFFFFIFTSKESLAKVSVVTSIYPLFSITKEIGGDCIDLSYIVPPGVSPHAYEIKPSDMVNIKDADLFIWVGENLESWLYKVVRTRKGATLKFCDKRDILEDNPHIWLDPIIVARKISKISSLLSEMDPKNSLFYKKRAKIFKKKLFDFDIWAKSQLIGEIFYISYHPAWFYFAKRYGIKRLGVVCESPGKEPGIKKIQKLIEVAKRKSCVILICSFYENPSLLKMIAKRSGRKLILLDPLGDPNDKMRSSYLGMMRYNVLSIKKVIHECYRGF